MKLLLFFLAAYTERFCYGFPPVLLWVDRFDYLDLDVWSHLVTSWGGGNQEFQYYRNDRRNSFVEDGILHIRPTFTADELGEDFLRYGNLTQPGCNREPCYIKGNGFEIVPPIFSARLSLQKSFSFKYGRLEVRAKLPRGDWIWPAIWLLPESEAHYGGWPMGGEIDVMESRGNKNLTDQNNRLQGVQRVGSTLHFGPNPNNNAFYKTNFNKLLKEGDFSDDFHTFGLEWSNTSISFSVDGVQTAEVEPKDGGFWSLGGFDKHPRGPNLWAKGTRMAPFDQKFYLILNVAVGGEYFQDGWKSNGKPKPWSIRGRKAKREFWEARKEWEPTWDRPEMLVDHVLIYGWD